MARPKTRMIAKNPLNPTYDLNNTPAKLGKHTLSDTQQLQRYVSKNQGNPFAYLCRIISGRKIICSHFDTETGEYRDVKVRANITQRNEAARILAAKMLPDLKALDVSATQQVNVDIGRMNTATLLSYLAAQKIDLREVDVVDESNAGVGDISNTSLAEPVVEQLDYQKTCESDDSPTPIQEVRTSDPAPVCLPPALSLASVSSNSSPEQLDQLVSLSDMPAGLDKPEPATTWTPAPPADLDTD